MPEDKHVGVELTMDSCLGTGTEKSLNPVGTNSSKHIPSHLLFENDIKAHIDKQGQGLFLMLFQGSEATTCEEIVCQGRKRLLSFQAPGAVTGWA